MKKKVLVGMSGGVDSSVTACLLKDAGYDVIGIHLRFWTDPTVFSPEESERFPQNKCCTLEGLNRTRRICHKLGIPFYVLNFEDSFKEHVVDYFVEGYERGITPNPCIECNRNVKFGLFLDKMKELGADYVATGHYARIQKTGDGLYELKTAKDPEKDQSYFLYTLTQDKLKHILFPIGEYTKKEVRKLAKKYGIDEVNDQKESQNLCFFPEKTHDPFLRRHIQRKYFKPGPIKTLDGRIIGQHKGLPTYTIGQRRGLGIGGIRGIPDGTTWFVVKIDKAENALIVGQEKDLYSSDLEAQNLSFIDGNKTADNSNLDVKIRARSIRQPASIKFEKNHAKITFKKPQRSVTPGQSVVLYKGDQVVGGGIISAN